MKKSATTVMKEWGIALYSFDGLKFESWIISNVYKLAGNETFILWWWEEKTGATILKSNLTLSNDTITCICDPALCRPCLENYTLQKAIRSRALYQMYSGDLKSAKGL